MKKLVAFACCACASSTWAADVGVGVSAESNDTTIFVPIDFGDGFRLEPFVRHYTSKIEIDDQSIRQKSLQIGAGLFALKPLGNSVNLYFGGRLSYLDLERSASFDLTDEHGHGYRVAPTFGFEYRFNEHLSFGGEAEWFYQDDGFGKDGGQRESGTDTRLILRLRF